MHVVLPPFGWYSPGRQCEQAVLGVLSLPVNSPGPHVLHWLFPTSFWYCPLKQFEHALAPAPETVPAAQSPHGFDAAATDVEYLPDAQSAHSALPADTLYLPAPHDVHVPPFSPVVPALQ